MIQKELTYKTERLKDLEENELMIAKGKDMGCRSLVRPCAQLNSSG